MAKSPQLLTKRLAISKANTQMVAAIAGASFVAVFCLVASKAVWSQYQYQAKVVTVKEKARDQLQSNLVAFDDLVKSYDKFDDKKTNVIGGSRDGTGDKDGSNSRIVLDALPSAYDFPALTSSLEKVLNNGSFSITNITGTDDQLNQQENSSSTAPQAVPIPFSFTVTNANYASVQNLMKTLQQSIRPMNIDSIELVGGANNMTLTVNAHTYYQPGKSLTITKEVVK